MDQTDNIERILDEQSVKYGLASSIIKKSKEWIKEHNSGLVRFSEIFSGDSYQNLPEFLFYSGDISLLKKFKLAAVGTRKPDEYGKGFTEKILRRYRNCTITTLSGFALGIDSAVHTESLKNGIGTIAVTGCGVGIDYPASNNSLKKEILKKGLFISEYSPYVRASRVDLISRNRIIASLADAVLIIQGGERSGTLNTLNWAFKMKKDIYALTGDANNKLSFAPNYAIYKGAKCIYSTDVLPEISKKKKMSFSYTEEEKKIADLIAIYKNADDVMKASPFTKEKVLSIITKLEMKGAIRRNFNGTIYLTED